MAMSKEANEA